jgi:hypothetical protein
MSTKNTNKNTNINENKIVIELPKVIRRKSTPRPKKTFAQAEEELNDLENKDRQYQKANYGQGLSGINPNIKISFNPSLYGFNKTPMEVPQQPQPQQQPQQQAEPQQQEEQTTTQSEPSAPQFGAFRENDLSNRSGFNDIRQGFSQSYSAPQFNRQDFTDRMNAEIPVAEPIDEGYMGESDRKPTKAEIIKGLRENQKGKEYLDLERQFLEQRRKERKEREERKEKQRGRPAGQPNRPKEEIQKEKQAKEEKRLAKEKANEEAISKAKEESRLKKEKEQKAVEENMKLIKQQEEERKAKQDKKKEKEERKGMRGEDTKKRKNVRIEL